MAISAHQLRTMMFAKFPSIVSPKVNVRPRLGCNADKIIEHVMSPETNMIHLIFEKINFIRNTSDQREHTYFI